MLSLFAGLALQLSAAFQPTFNGIRRELTVPAVRADASVVIDGTLDEPVWRTASLLTGFSTYTPVDGRPADDDTEVLVWYSATALYIGIRAAEPHGTVRATLAERDRISGDDNVEIHLDTFDDRRRAMVFIVNPLGIQGDGTKSEGGGFIPGSNVMPGQTDLSADFVWESRGRVTASGYEVELRIPFSSLRYPTAMPQQWGFQVLRHVQHSGHEQTFTPARRASASFISQAATLAGLTGMHHGVVVEANPELTSTIRGAPCCSPIDIGFRHQNESQLGGNLRAALGSNFVLNGTVKPDFSQVEADATQIAADQRFALFYPERRPFFVEGSDNFNVPNTLVYTRRIVQPEAAAKLTGKFGRTDVATLLALDDRLTTRDSTLPTIGIVRLSRAVGSQSTAGLLYSGRTSGSRGNHVAGADARLVFGRLYYAQFQAVASLTDDGGVRRSAPLWEAVVDRTGRSFGFHYGLIGIGNGFETDNGFVPRTGYVQPSIANRYSIYGTPGSLMERYNLFVQTFALWKYDDLFAGRGMLERRAVFNNQLTLRGGWSVNVNPAIGNCGFDPAEYQRTFTAVPSGTPLQFVPSDRITTALGAFSVNTPQFRRFSASIGGSFGNDVDFVETSAVRRRDYNALLLLRPTDRLRVEGRYVSTSFTRRADGTPVLSTRIPRVKAEYQIARPIFVRVVAQYESASREASRDPRTGLVLLVPGAAGALVPSVARASNTFRTDWLFSYRPSPGTVFFAGYGNTLSERDPLAFRDLERQGDALFVKVSYVLGTRQGR